MKGKLEFNLNNPEEKDAFDRAVNVDNLYSAMYEFSQEVLRKWRKYGIPEEIKTNEDLIEEMERKFYEYLQERNINLG